MKNKGNHYRSGDGYVFVILMNFSKNCECFHSSSNTFHHISKHFEVGWKTVSYASLSVFGYLMKDTSLSLMNYISEFYIFFWGLKSLNIWRRFRFTWNNASRSYINSFVILMKGHPQNKVWLALTKG